MANEFYLKQGDTYPNLETILSDENGPVLLTGASVTFKMSGPETDDLMLERAAVIISPQTGGNIGRCYFEFEDGDTDIVGTYNAEWEVTFAGGKKATFPRSKKVADFNKVIIQKGVS